jgi:hypothetical protein
MTTTSDDDTMTDTDDGMDIESLTALDRAFTVIAANPKLAMEVIEQIAYLTRHHDDIDPEDVRLRAECHTDLVETVCLEVGEYWQKQMAEEVAEISRLHQLGRFMLSEIDKTGEDDALYVLISGIAGLIADYLAEMSELIWTFGTNDKTLIDMSIADDFTPKLAPGALDRARSAMREAGWLSWRIHNDGFEYTLTPPENWRELVKENEAAIAVAERDAQGGALQ